MTDYQSMSQDEADPLIAKSSDDGDFTPSAVFEDHFSLEAPSDQIRFRTNAVRVYTSGTQQFQIVETSRGLKAKVVRLYILSLLVFVVSFCLAGTTLADLMLTLSLSLFQTTTTSTTRLRMALRAFPCFVLGMRS